VLIPLQQFPGVPPGPICLSDIIPSPDGCVEPPDLCKTIHLHRTISIRVGTSTLGPFIDTFMNPCGHGAVTTQPQCGPDDVPACMQ
jgi:hypothetical protein